VEQSAPQVFSGITPERWAKLMSKAQAAGIDLNANSGTASQYGVEVTWNYVPDTKKLTLQCLSAPFFVNLEDVNARIRALVKESAAADTDSL